MKQAVIIVAAAAGLMAHNLQAQYHSKETSSGQTVVNPQAQANIKVQSNARIGRGVIGQVNGQNVPQSTAMYLGDWAVNKGITLSEMGGRKNYVLGQTLHHSDGSYTKTDREEKSTRTNMVIVQKTYSPEGILVSKRYISHNKLGQPSEVIIRDAQNNPKYRGVLVYDPLSHRLLEEQLFDVNDKPLRRTIQQYDVRGNIVSNQIYDYVKNIPADLRLVVTKENAKGEGPTEKKFNLFGKDKEKGAPLIPGFGNKPMRPRTTVESKERKERKGFAKFLLGGRNRSDK